MRFSSRRPFRLSHSLPAAACLLAVAGCSSGGPVPVAVPTPSDSAAKPDSAAALCRALHAALPRSVDGLSTHATSPTSAYTAAWGDPAVTLRCGVPTPEVLTPGTAHYDPTADAAAVNGVNWLVEQRSDGYRFTTTDRKAFVEVTVPSKYSPEVNPLTDLADAVKKAVPTTLPG